MPPAWLPLAALAAIIAASTLRLIDVERRHGVRGYSFGKHASVQHVAERTWRLATILALGCALIAWLAPGVEPLLGEPSWAQAPWLRWAGAGLLAGSALLIATAQIQMGASWRIGVPADGPGPLVEHGLFAWSRNPIFAGMIGAALGLLLWSPHMLSAALLAFIWSLSLVQVRIEEDALRQTHGDAYEHYAAHVGRWFGRRSFHRC